MNRPKKKAKTDKNKKDELLKILLEVCEEYGVELRVPRKEERE